METSAHELRSHTCNAGDLCHRMYFQEEIQIQNRNTAQRALCDLEGIFSLLQNKLNALSIYTSVQMCYFLICKANYPSFSINLALLIRPCLAQKVHSTSMESRREGGAEGAEFWF